MTYSTAVGIGHIHRHLCQPMTNDSNGRMALWKKLKPRSTDSLKYVCVDLDYLPSEPITKEEMIENLIAWVSLSFKSKPRPGNNLDTS